MEEFNRYFRYIADSRLVICKTHKSGIVMKGDGFARHLTDYHKSLQTKATKSMREYVKTLDVATEPDEIVIPEVGEAYPCIALERECLKCDECGKFEISLKSMQRHCRKEHDWKSGKSTGGSKSHRRSVDANKMWSEGHTCQRLFTKAEWPGLVEVEDIRMQVTFSPSRRRHQRLGIELLKQEEEMRKKDEEDAVVKLVGTVRQEVRNWVEFTRWDRHLLGFNINKLKQCVQPVMDGESAQQVQAIDEASRAVGKMFKHAQMACNKNNVSVHALKYVTRQSTGTDHDESTRALHVAHKATTMVKYSAVWAKLLRYAWRSMDWRERPKYDMTIAEETAIVAVRDSAERVVACSNEGEKKKERHKLRLLVLEFFIEMMRRQIRDDDYESLIMSGLAVLGLDQDGVGWVEAINYTPKLAAVNTMARVMVVYYAYEKREAELEELFRSGCTVAEAEEKGTTVLQRVMQLTTDVLTLQHDQRLPRPIDQIQAMKAYGRAIRSTTKAEARVGWSDNGETVSIDKVTFTMTELARFVRDMAEDCRERLIKKLCFTSEEEMLDVKIKQLLDDHGEGAAGWSFLKDPRNRELLKQDKAENQKWTESELWLYNRMLQEQRMSRAFLNDSDEGSALSEDGIDDYFHEVMRFKEELIILCHLGGGAPARGPELISIEHRNSKRGGGVRGVYIDNGLVELVTTYHKGYSLSRNIKVIHRYLPDEIGKLVVWYLWLVQPFVERLQATRKQLEHGDFIWEPLPEEVFSGKIDAEDEDENEDVDEEEEQPDGRREDIIRREREREEAQRLEQEFDEDEEEEVVQRLKYVKEETKPTNCDGRWNSERLKRVMRREGERRGFVQLNPSMWRQVYPAIQRHHCGQDEEVGQLLDEVYLGKAPDNPMMQTGHKKITGFLNYGILLTESPNSTQLEQKRFRYVSMRWHQFLRFESAREYRFHNGNDGLDGKQEEQAQIRTMERLERLKKCDIDEALSKITGSRMMRAEFRSDEQRQAVEAVMRREMRVLVVMGTGVGKSMIYMLPASCSMNGVTVVVMPLLSLMDDQYRRCVDAGLRVAKWTEATEAQKNNAQVILISPESAITKRFNRFLLRCKTLGCMDRVVIDECHYVLETNDTFRKDVAKLREMVTKGTQMVYMTATLPIKDEDVWFKEMGLRGLEVYNIRASTVRKNVRYVVKMYDSRRRDETLEKEVKRLLDKYRVGKVIVYCGRVKECEQVGVLLKCPAFHATIEGGEIEKRKILTDLVSGGSRVFAATNALGLGIDAPHVRAVVHLGPTSQMRGYAQESGRAGRDGEPAEAVLLRSVTVSEDGKEHWQMAVKMEEAMEQYMTADRCRRVTLDREMDGPSGYDRAGCRIGEQRCDVCSGDAGEGMSTVLNSTQARREADEHIEQIEQRQEARESDVGEDSTLVASEHEFDDADVFDDGVFDLMQQSVTPIESVSRKRERERAQSMAEQQRLAKVAREYHDDLRHAEDETRDVVRFKELEDMMDEDRLQELMQMLGQSFKCMLCWVGGDERQKRVALQEGMSWEQCGKHTSEEKASMREWCAEFSDINRRKYDWKAKCGCLNCFLPQRLCHRWEEKVKQYGSKTPVYQMKKDVRCQFYGVVMRVLAAYYTNKMRDQNVHQQDWSFVLQRCGEVRDFHRQSVKQKDGMMEDYGGQMKRWIKQPIVQAGMETNNAVLFVYQMCMRQMV